MFRFYAPYEKAKVEEKLRKFVITEKENFKTPENNFLARQRIIATTCKNLTHILGMGFKQKMTHIIIKDASQILEPESLIPLSLVSFPENNDYCGTSIVLSGDPHQFSPPLLSPQSSFKLFSPPKFGFSLVERLFFAFPLYRQREENFYSSFLSHNYSLHPLISKLVSDLFYGKKKFILFLFLIFNFNFNFIFIFIFIFIFYFYFLFFCFYFYFLFFSFYLFFYFYFYFIIFYL